MGESTKYSTYVATPDGIRNGVRSTDKRLFPQGPATCQIVSAAARGGTRILAPTE